MFTRKALPSRHGPAFQNSLLGNLEAWLEGKTTVGKYTVSPPTPTVHTRAAEEVVVKRADHHSNVVPLFFVFFYF